MVQYKGDRLTRYIEGKVICGNFRPGQRIPSLRQLMDKFDISMNTARRSIMGLVEKGILEFHHGSGTYVARKQRFPNPCVLGIVHSNYYVQSKDSTFSGLASMGTEGLASEMGFQIRDILVNSEEMNDHKIETLTPGLEGLVLLGGYDAFLKYPHLGIPAVGLTMHQSFDGLFSLVDLDPFRAAELCCDFFKRQGMDKVLVIRRERPNFIFREKIFIQMWEELGGEIVDVVREHAPDFCPGYAYLYTCGTCAVEDAEAYAVRTGRRLAEDCVVLCIDGKPMFSPLSVPELPTIAINWRTAGAVAAEECMRRIRNPGSVARRIYLSPKLYSIS